MRSSEIDLEILLRNRAWEFSDTNGRIIASSIYLTAGGKVRGYRNPNEKYWRIHGGALEFISESGTVTTRFRAEIGAEPDKVVFSGLYLGNPELGIIHRLSSRDAVDKNQKSLNQVIVAIPIHKNYFVYGINFLYQSFGSDFDIAFIFSSQDDRLAFSEMHPSSNNFNYFSIILEEYFTQDAITIVAQRYTWPSLKKMLSLYLLQGHFDYIVGLDAEIFILRTNGWHEAAKNIISAKKWYGGKVHSGMTREREILLASGRELPNPNDHEKIKDITQDYKIYSWWWDLPVVDCRHVSKFLKWINWDLSADFVARFGWDTFDHVTYQYYTVIFEGFEIHPVDWVTHSLEFSRSEVVEEVHKKIGALHWTNAFAYANNPDFYKEKNYLAVFHIDRKIFPQFE